MDPENKTLTEQIGQLVADLEPDFASQIKILGLLAEGRPLEMSEVAGELHLPLDKTKLLLTRMGGEFDERGSLVGLGLTSIPTRHAFEVNGHELYAWCAGDTLLFPLMLGKTAKVVSIDPVSGEKIRLTVGPEGVRTMEPSTAVLSWPASMDAKDIRGTVCYPSNWFASRETAQRYASEHPGVGIITPDEFRKVSRFLGRLAGPSSACGNGSPSEGLSCH